MYKLSKGERVVDFQLFGKSSKLFVNLKFELSFYKRQYKFESFTYTQIACEVF